MDGDIGHRPMRGCEEQGISQNVASGLQPTRVKQKALDSYLLQRPWPAGSGPRAYRDVFTACRRSE